MIYLLLVVLAGCCYIMGESAFRAGLAPKRWALLGFCLGPAAWPLLQTHKQWAYRRCSQWSDIQTEM